MTTETLISLVENQPSVWDKGAEVYRDRYEKEKAWLGISSGMFPDWDAFSSEEQQKNVCQEAINFCVDRLQDGEWVHVFPEGKVNMNKEFIRLKWGVGRMIYDSPVTPIVVPIWHIGMEEILPNEPPYILKTGKKVTFNFGEPINFSNLLKELKEARVNAECARQVITEKIQVELMNLKIQTEALHKLYHS